MRSGSLRQREVCHERLGAVLDADHLPGKGSGLGCRFRGRGRMAFVSRLRARRRRGGGCRAVHVVGLNREGDRGRAEDDRDHNGRKDSRAAPDAPPELQGRRVVDCCSVMSVLCHGSPPMPGEAYLRAARGASAATSNEPAGSHRPPPSSRGRHDRQRRGEPPDRTIQGRNATMAVRTGIDGTRLGFHTQPEPGRGAIAVCAVLS